MEHQNLYGLYNSQTDRSLWGSGVNSETGKNVNIGNIGKYYTSNESEYANRDKNEKVCAFDVDEETIRHEPWTGTGVDFKKNLDAFLYGDIRGAFIYPSGALDNDGHVKQYDYAKELGKSRRIY